jgi:hypothetical protein
MKNICKFLLSIITLSAISLSIAHAELFEVTVTNLTRGQIFSPIFAVTHNKKEALFTTGAPATPELAALAQDANTDLLTGLLSASPDVHEIAHGSGPILPGKSETLLIHGNYRARFISLASMLVTTNDAFMSVNKLKLPFHSSILTVPAYDAGAEANDESCNYIPGPPCGNANAASNVEGEGFVHIHAGIHGVGDLNTAQYDWRNPVAKVSIRRVRKHY